MVPKNISFYILMDDSEFKEAVKNNDETKMEEILYKYGIDTYLPYQIVSCEHRVFPSTDNPLTFNGPLVQGVERQDKDWMNAGYSSFENVVDASNDPSLRAELKWIGRQGSCDVTWQSESVAKKVAYNEKRKGV